MRFTTSISTRVQWQRSSPTPRSTLAAGVTANMSAVFETLSDGTIYAVESESDQVLAISPGNSVSVEIDAANFSSSAGWSDDWRDRGVGRPDLSG